MRTIDATGAAPAEEIWRRYTRPALWPGWAPHIRRVVTDVDVIEPGACGTVRGPLVAQVRFRILDVDHAARCWSWWVGLGPAGVVMEHGVDPAGVDPAGGGGSRAWLRVRAPGLLVAPYAPVAALALRRLVRPARRPSARVER